MKRNGFLKRGFALVVAAGALVIAPTPPAAAAQARPAAFAEAGAVWMRVREDAAALDRALAAGRSAEVRERASAIRDAVVTLPYKSEELPAANRKRLARHVETVAEVARRLDRNGAAGQIRQARAEQARLRTALGAIASVYPAGALAGGAAAVAAAAPHTVTPSAKERALFLTPGGLYTRADIEANGRQTVSQRYPDFAANHDAKPKPGQRVCPISETLANPKLRWVIGGKTYTFCCPPCVSEFVARAKKDPSSIRPPEAYVKR
jgi:hypothetical protein